MQHFPNALNYISPDMWETTDVGVLLIRFTSASPLMTESTVDDLLSPGLVLECIDASYSRKIFSTPLVTTYGTTGKRLTADSPVWTALSGTDGVLGAITYVDGATDADRHLLAYYDEFYGPLVGGDVTFSITWLYDFQFAS